MLRGYPSAWVSETGYVRPQLVFVPGRHVGTPSGAELSLGVDFICAHRLLISYSQRMVYFSYSPGQNFLALVAEHQGRLVGLAHYLLHRSTTQIAPYCYMQDLFTDEKSRRLGIGKALINAVYDRARSAGLKGVYWQTHETNLTAMKLYDQVAARSGFVVYAKSL